jgi:anti-sigma factor RsiW
MNGRPITEDDLQAFVDDALAPERRGHVSEYLLTNVDAAARVAAYQEQAAALRQSLDPVADEPVPSRLNLENIAASHRATTSRPGRLRLAAAAAVLLAIGATGGWLTKGYMLPPTEGVAALALEASASYGAFAADRLRPVEVRADGSDTLQQLASATLGSSVAIPDLGASGYRLMGGRVVPTTHGAGFMLMYDDDKGNRIVMLARRMLVDQNRPMVASTAGDVNGWSWAKDGMGYSIVGSIPAENLHPVADVVRSQI